VVDSIVGVPGSFSTQLVVGFRNVSEINIVSYLAFARAFRLPIPGGLRAST
jgi:hypothetical protein